MPSRPSTTLHLKRRSLLAAALLSAWPLSYGQAAKSALADAEQFFRPEQMLGAELAPDGKRLAMRVVGPHGRVMLSVLDLGTMSSKVVYSSDAADVQRVVWVNPLRLAFTLEDRETAQGKLESAPGLFAVDHDGENYRQLVERQRVFVKVGNDAQLQPWNTYLLNGSSQRRGDEVLVLRPEAYSEKDVGFVKLLRLNTKTGRSEEIAAPLHAVGWWADEHGNLRVVRTRQGEQGSIRWKDPQSGEWRVLNEFNVYTQAGELQVRHVDPDGKLYVTAQRGSDKAAMWLLDPTKAEWSGKPLASSPLFDVDAAVIARQDKVLGLRFTIDAEVTQWLDADMQALQAQIDKVLPNTVNRLSPPWSGDAPWVLIEAFADVQPTLFYLYNRATKKFSKLGALRPDIKPQQMATMDLHRIKARDGLELPVWLTLPAGSKDKKNLPMVVLVHGGPFVRGPSWQWDAEVQLLAARGYAVLQPQFRGTLGFGATHHLAGWRQWGKAMQTDIADATRWAIAQGIADPQRIAVAGASYGGYATLMGLLREPELFRAGVAWVAVTDLDMLHTVNWSDISDSEKKHGMPALLGDRVKDAADLKENSPLTHAAKIKQPLLLAYGSADKRVPLVHGEAFSRAIKATNPSVEYIVYEDEGHGWRVPANQIDFWNRTLKFLDQQLGVK
ncbi:S9 family peptidase [Roseateles albus]|uniref:Prolyl oligopeptidase family serine peptidase n=1 Tax=Roseateles albus TaxID=2987525 RepID=A0ABT5K805_9BURK|nr:alpha/beta fold hydrolase [Roseateles albus]MDC8770091.1 prolyl oligopeptidase family serine peptidase [Roseateles albus]